MRRALLVAAVGVACVAAAAFLYLQRGPTRESVVAGLVETVYVPGFRQFRDDAGALAAAVDAHCAAPSLEAARAAWRKARTAWKVTEAYQFGPARELRIASSVDFWPMRPWAIESELAKTGPVDAATLPAPAKGFGALELLLFGERSAQPAPRDCDYLRAVAADLKAQAEALVKAWEAGPAVMLDAAVNQLVSLAYTIEDMKLARPIGKRHGNTPQPEAVESPVSHHSLADMEANLVGLRAVLQQLEPLVARTDAAVIPAALAAVAELETALKAVQPTLAEAASAQAPSGEAAFKAAAKVTKVLATQLVGALGVTPTFSDNDGD